MRIFIGVISCILIAGLATGCEKQEPKTSAPEKLSLPSLLVEPDWLAENLPQRKLVVIDARAPEKYAAGHVEGAINVPTKSLLDPAPDRSSNIAGVGRIQKVFSEAGVSMDDIVVVYDDADDYRPAARVFLILEVHGHTSVGVLNGGYTSWVSKKLPISTEPFRRAPAQFIANLRPERLTTKLAVARNIQTTEAIILDARSPEEFAGRKSEASRAGHIPTAVNVSSTTNVAAGKDYCQFKVPDELKSVYSALPADKKVITYCNSGNRASVSYLALRLLGRDVSVYDGSWLEWGNDATLPIEAANGSDDGQAKAE